MKLVQILSSVVLIWVCLYHPAIRPFVHFLVHFLLLLAIETLNVNDNMIFKCVKLVQILSSVVLMWVCLSDAAITSFVYFLVHFFLLLAFETLNVNDNMIFECVRLVKNTIVGCFDMGVSFPPSNKAICLFFSTFPIMAGF